ncbi:tyrosine-type recombinase/integrase [Novosphingobium sp. BW1]|uniref:tyrosine-type recombinase/integrase n=1 Tax=Novosphingobium sp. BW1 TaxID=2592621 RepID=UPI0013C2FA24|nr:tyrosine-type recombinase/integrase [Novosphingobium sp. BW1]
MAFHAEASPHLSLALTLALWTGQRQGDLLRLPWSAYNGDSIRLRQSKTKLAIEVPVGAPLREALQEARDRYEAEGLPIPETIPATERGSAWTEGGFRASWRKACIKAGVTGVTFHDLRGTAVTRLAVAGATVPEIATITGHKLKEVGSILDAHYMNRDRALGEAAIRKLEANDSPK